jgi:methyl-accepting chemotaxis protein
MTAFATILVVTAILGVFSINRLSAVNDNVVDLSSNYLVATYSLGEVDYNTTRFRQLQAAHLLVTTPEATAK